MSGFIDQMLAGTRITFEAEGIAPISVSLDPNAPTSPITKLLKPKVTVKSGTEILYQTAPYGSPSGVPWLYIGAGIIIVVLLYAALK